MSNYDTAYKQLNPEQKRAVDTIQGPVLVIAGPGTGKTQLLSARVAKILQATDTPAQNILCLTFTESGADNMRERLTRFIGKSAYEVNIGTYHAFGSDLIGRYPEYFATTRMQNAVDELGKRQIVLELVEAMRYDNPLKQTRHHLGDLISTLSEIKRALLEPDDLRKIAAQNSEFIDSASKLLSGIFAGLRSMPGTLAKSRPLFQETLIALAAAVPEHSVSDRFQSLGRLCVSELQQALEDAEEQNKSTPLTKWKNKWLSKDSQNNYIIAGELENRRIYALAEVLEQYHSAMSSQGLYDFDDMIIRSIDALEKYPDLRYTLQERYLYVLLDEFQDTNAAQLRLVQLLTDNPIHEGRPNVLAVGDDDQAIYAFQGAKYSNMIEYYGMYRDTIVINLTDNYRSHTHVIEAASNIASQIEARLHQNFPGMSKTLHPANTKLQNSVIQRQEFLSEVAERAWIAREIKRLIDAGTAPSQIAVLAPKHRILEPLVPYLNHHDIPVRYEKRENILEAPVVRQLITMSKLLIALAENNHQLAASLWPQVLSYDFWEIPVDTIWRLSWQVSDSNIRRNETTEPLSWSKAVLDCDDEKVRAAAHVLLHAAARTSTDSCEMILDYLIGSSALHSPDQKTTDKTLRSPLRDYYTSQKVQELQPELFYMTLSHLNVLRARLREFQDRADNALMIGDFVKFVGMYETAEQPMIDTSPYSQSADAVQLLTVFKAKGLEYEHVFLPSCLDEVWGSSSHGNSNKLTLPANLQPIRHAGATDDERLRILFVAITRARHGLHLTSSTHTFTGKSTKRLKYFEEHQSTDGTVKTMILPESSQQVISGDTSVPDVKLLEMDWHTRHTDSLKNIKLQNILGDRISKYQLGPTNLVSFVDLEYAGPQQFLLDNILKFPHAPTPYSQYGTAIHETMEWYQHKVNELGYGPPTEEALDYFAIRMRAKKLTEQQTLLEIDRGNKALRIYLKQRAHIFSLGDVTEKSFYSEGSFLGDVHMTGRIDRLEIDKTNRTITVVDYKTGKAHTAWSKDIKLHKYKLQLYAYKLLIEGSRTYAGYTVARGRLEFVEPSADKHIHTLELTFDDKELDTVKKLLHAVWKHIKDLDFPDTTQYPATLAGMTAFEQDLIDGNI